ncbi:MAG: CRISPR-associated endonuclease Cas1, partial [Burkholderiales bacterium]
MSTLYVTTEDTVLRKADERLKVTRHKETLIDVPLLKVTSVVLFGRVSVTPDAMQSLLEHQIDLCFLTAFGKYIGRMQPPVSGNSLLRKAQFRAAESPTKCLRLSQGFIKGKLANMRVLLVRQAREEQEGSDRRRALDAAITRIKLAEASLARAGDVDQARGHEGEASAQYFGVFDHLIKQHGQDGFVFEKRLKRPPTDPVNAMLSFGYALLANDLHSAINIVGLDPYIGYLHADRHGKPSLALDLMEEFRALVVDSVVLMMINKRMVTPEDFEYQLGGVCRMADAARRTFLRQYEERKLTEFRHPIFNYKMSYRQA